MNKTDLHGKFEVLMLNRVSMKKYLWMFVVVILVSACKTPKPYYETAKGKKKQKYYNDIQFGGKSASEMKRKH